MSALWTLCPPIVQGYIDDDVDLLDGRQLTLKRKNVEEEEVVIGDDQRIRVGRPIDWPWRVHGKMIMTFPNGKTFIGSGTLINTHHVLTAGHCVYSKDNGGWAVSVSFSPAQNDFSKPFGTARASMLCSVKGWTENNNPDWDFGMLVLNQKIGEKAGWLGGDNWP